MSARSGSVSGVFVTPIAGGRKLPSCATRDVAHDRHSTLMPMKDKVPDHPGTQRARIPDPAMSELPLQVRIRSMAHPVVRAAAIYAV